VLDSETEAAILKRLQQELAGCSLVYSLPRPRLASAFDRILIMEQGRVVDQGRFAELEKPGGAGAADSRAVIRTGATDRDQSSAATLVSGMRVHTRAVAHNPTAAKLKKAVLTPKWSATSPATVVLNVAPPPMARPPSPREVV
jgi:ABC-type multidrug transport system ATPase subunit